MRVITGTARGRTLRTLEGEQVRPTTQRAKEAMFSAIQFEIEGRRVLDLCAGCGQLGIEALSRGAASAVFVDSAPESIRVIRENLDTTGFAPKSVVHRQQAKLFLQRCAQTFDIVLVDPPYASGVLQDCLPFLPAVVAPGGVVLCEGAAAETLPPQIETLFRQKVYKHGKTTLTLYRNQTQAAEGQP